MTIEQLVKELSSPVYKSEEKKIEKLKKYLKTDYLNYELKIGICERILKASRYQELMGRKFYSPNGPLEYELKIIALVQAYYKDITFREDEDRLEDFNLLEKNDYSKLIIAAIGEDIKRFDAVYGMMSEDLSYKESLVPYIDTKFETIRLIIDRGLNMIENQEMKEKVSDLFSLNNNTDNEDNNNG